MTRRLRSVLLFAAAGFLAACQFGPGRSGESSGSSVEGRSESGRAAGSQRNGRSSGAPRPQPLLLPAGTALPIQLETTLSSESSHAGDLVVAKLLEDVRAGERVALPAGSELRGRVTAAVSGGRVKGRARLALRFESVELKDKRHDLETTPIDITADPTKKKDAFMIGGGAGAGALIGGIAGGKKGAGIGALIGAGAGTGAVLATKGKEIELNSGSHWTLKLTREARLD